MITHITVEDAAKLISRLTNANETQALTYIREAADQGEIQAADALEKLQAELEQVKAERDAAIADWRGFCAKCAWNGKQHLSDGQMDARCRTCRENRKCNWEWRGQKEG